MSEQPSNIYDIDQARKAQVKHEVEHVDATPLSDGDERYFHEASKEYDAEAVIAGRLAQEYAATRPEKLLSPQEILHAKLINLVAARRTASGFEVSKVASDNELAA